MPYKIHATMKKILLLVLFTILFCKQNPEKKIGKILANPSLTDETALVLIAREVWGTEFKTAETERLKNSKIGMKVVFGSKLAVTFYKQEEYARIIATNISVKILQMIQAGKSKNLDSIVVVFSKPFYIKGTDEIQDDFEIYRVRVNLSELKDLNEILSTNHFETTGNDRPSERVLQSAEKIRKTWKEELNDFGRIEIK